MEKFIRKYNEDYIIAREEAHRVVVKPFTLATQADKRERAEIDRRYGVKLTNLDYELNRSEIYSIAKDFG